MRVGISSKGFRLDSNFDPRFGRAHWICIYDTESKLTEYYQNEFIDASNGAGIQLAKQLHSLKVEKVISGHFGPKAKDMLDKLNIVQQVQENKEVCIQDIISQFSAN